MAGKSSSTGKLYQIKVVLKDSKPPIWRRLLVSSEIRLYDLHKVIQIAMGWTNSHLHQFEVGGEYYGIPHGYDWEPVIDEREVRMSEIAPAEGKKFAYEYDFGDSWGHDVIIEKILPIEPGEQYPKCIKGKRACPPEDVGGIWGYEEFLEAMKDPNHAEHVSYAEWWGGQFDPEEFDMEETNQALKDIDQFEWWDDM